MCKNNYPPTPFFYKGETMKLPSYDIPLDELIEKAKEENEQEKQQRERRFIDILNK